MTGVRIPRTNATDEMASALAALEARVKALEQRAHWHPEDAPAAPTAVSGLLAQSAAAAAIADVTASGGAGPVPPSGTGATLVDHMIGAPLRTGGTWIGYAANPYFPPAWPSWDHKWGARAGTSAWRTEQRYTLPWFDIAVAATGKNAECVVEVGECGLGYYTAANGWQLIDGYNPTSGITLGGGIMNTNYTLVSGGANGRSGSTMDMRTSQGYVTLDDASGETNVVCHLWDNALGVTKAPIPQAALGICCWAYMRIVPGTADANCQIIAKAGADAWPVQTGPNDTGSQISALFHPRMIELPNAGTWTLLGGMIDVGWYTSGDPYSTSLLP